MGTLRVPNIVPSPVQDCETLKKSFKGWGTDEKTVIRVLGHRNANQRNKIKETYQQLYKKSLIQDLHSELSGDFRRAIILWSYDPPERDAKLINKALKAKTFWRSKGVKYWQVIVEIACASSPNHLMVVRQAYCSLFEHSLEEAIMSYVSPPLRKLLVGLVSSYRCDMQLVEMNVAKSEASRLQRLVKMKQLDDDYLVWILSTRNFAQIRATFACYKQEFSRSFEVDILTCGNGDLQALLRVISQCIESPEKHFAQVVRTAILGLGTDEDSLTRAIVTRAEVDMMKIKEEYSRMYKTSVEDDVIGDTSGDYKKFLLTLLGAK